eukprot:XP_015576598.1 basic form of pathogenesis-related protein 1 [Ricinus communis]
MGFTNLVIALCLVASALSPTCLARNSRGDYLDAHNAVRAEVGVDPLVWNKTLADYAKGYAKTKINNFVYEHSNYLQFGYGECLAASPQPNFNAKDAVKIWADEKKFYDRKSNSCKGGECGHYTQIVWHDTSQVGCARVKCKNGHTFISCNYYPIGNVQGQSPY